MTLQMRSTLHRTVRPFAACFSSRFVAAAALVCLGCIVGSTPAVAQANYSERIVTTAVNTPGAAVVDASGNIFTIAYFQVEELLAVNGVVPANPTVRMLGTGAFTQPRSLALDSSGDLFVADTAAGTVSELVAVNGVIPENGTARTLFAATTNSSTTSIVQPSIAVDGNGNVFFEEYVSIEYGNSDGYLLELVAVNGMVPANPQINTVYTESISVGMMSTGGAFYLGPLAEDSKSNLFMFYQGSALYEFSSVNGAIPANTTPQILIPQKNSLNSYYGFYGSFTVDRKGNIFIGDQNENSAGVIGQVQELVAVNGSVSVNSTLLTLYTESSKTFNPGSLAMDASGNIFATSPAASKIIEVSPNNGFPPTAVGSTSPAVTVEFALPSASTISSITASSSLGGKTEFNVGTLTNCVADGGTSNAAGSLCTLSMTFSPAYAGARTAQLKIVTSAVTSYYPLTGSGLGPVVSFAPGTVTVVAGTGKPGYSGDGGAATSAQINAFYIRTDAAGNIYIADHNTIRRVDAINGNISLYAGVPGQNGYSGDGGPATSATLYQPKYMSLDASGNLYFINSGYNQIRKITAATGIISLVGGNGQAQCNGDGGAATQAQMGPLGLAVDAAGNVYFSDACNTIRYISAGSGIVSTIAGNGTYGDIDGAAAAAEFRVPTNLALDSAGNLYIADASNRAVRKLTPGGTVSTVAGGQGYNGSKLTGDGGPATAATFDYIQDVAVDAAGNIYMLDLNASTIRIVHADTGIINTIVGQDAVTYQDNHATSAYSLQIDQTSSFDLDALGNILITDPDSGTVLKISSNSPALIFPTTTNVGTLDSKDDPQTATLINIGSAAVTLTTPATGTNPAISSGFLLDSASTCPQLSSMTAPASVASGGSCTFAVDFQPTTAGTNAGTLVVTDTTLNTTAVTQTVQLTGMGSGGATQAPTATLTPATYDFGKQNNGSISMNSFTLTAGPVALTNTITLPSANAGQFTDSGDNCATLAAGASCTINVLFRPTLAGALSATLTVTSTGGGTTITETASLNGTGGQPPTVTVTPTPVVFSATAVNTTATTSATLTNTGTGNLTLGMTAATVGGTDTANFKYAGSNCGYSLAPGSFCSLTVTFTPDSARTFNATLNIATNDPNSPAIVPLTGTGTTGGTPQATFVPTSLTFAATTVGMETAGQNFNLTNNGTASLTIANVVSGGTNAGSFVITANACNATLTAGASCILQIAFQPTTTGTLSGTITVTDNAGGTAGSMQIGTFTGTGIAGSAAFNPTSGTFAATTAGARTASQTFTLTNAGPGIVTIASTALSGANAGSFVITANTCAAAKQLASGASCAISVAFNPTAIGPLAATLLITDDSGGVAGSMQTVTLTGTGTAPTATLTPVSTALGTVGVGLQTTTILTLTNTSNGVLPAGSAQFTGTNGTTAPAIGNCSVALAAGASCSFSVIANPIQAGAFSGTATFVNSAGTQTATVSGTAAGPVLTPSPTFDFDGVALTTTTTQVFTLKNIEVSTVILNSIKVTGTGFAQQSSTCGTTLAPNATCTITVAFGPTTAGATTGTLAVSDSSGTNPSVTLTGTGVMGSATLTPAMYGFGAVTIGSPVTTIFTLANTGTTGLAIKAVMFANQAGFVNFTATNNCGSSLAFSSSCSISVTATATAASSGTAVLVVQDSGGGHSAALSATGTLPNAVLTPGAATFPSTVIGSTNSQTFTLTNNGTSSITVTSASLSPGSGTTSAFKVSSNNCTTLIAAASCSIVVVYTPTAATTDTATLLVFDTAGTQTAALTGTGLAPSDFALRLDTLDGPTLIDPSSGKSVFGLFTDVNTSQPFHGTILLSASSTDLSPQSTYTFSPATGPFSTPAQFDGPNEGFLTVFDSTFRLYQANQTPMYRRIHSGGSAPLVILAGVFFVFFLRRRSLRFRPLLTLALVAGLLPLALTSTGCAWFAGPGYAICGSGLQTSYCSAKVTITGTNGSIVHSITGTLYY